MSDRTIRWWLALVLTAVMLGSVGVTETAAQIGPGPDQGGGSAGGVGESTACTVTSLEDNGGAGTLRALVDNPDCAVIDFDLPADLLPGQITLTTGRLNIARDVAINGPGAHLLAVSGNHASRVFFITSGMVSIDGLTIRDGRAVDGNFPDTVGGGLFNEGVTTVRNSVITANTAGVGGGVYNGGTLTIDRSTVSGNSADSGGGIGSAGTVTITNSTIPENTAQTTGGMVNNRTATVVNTTFSGNSASQAIGGIRNTPSGRLTLDHVTITNNSAPSAGGIWNDVPQAGSLGEITLRNSIIAGNHAPQLPDCFNRSGQFGTARIVSEGHNLIGDTTGCTFTPAATDVRDVSAELGELADNGGPTQTHALLAGSPAIDHIPAADCAVATDQRGVARPQGTGCDIGAFELAVDSTPPVITVSVDGTLGSNDWYISNVTVSWAVSDDESTVSSTTGCDESVVDFDTKGTSFTCSAISDGGSPSKTVTVKRDASPPVISFTGGDLTYTVDQDVVITCSASDPTSLIASQACEEASGPAYTFGVGVHTLTASATNGAGLGASASTSFTVVVTYTSLGTLTRRFVTNANAHALVQKLEAAAASAARGNAKAKAGQLGAYQNHVRALTGKSIAAEHAAVLIRLAGAL